GATVEALMRDLRHGGTKALEEPATKRRLSELSDDQIVQVGNRLHRLRPEIAQMDSRGSGNFVSGEAQTMTDTTFVDAREIFEKVKGEEAAKRQAESDGSWPVMDAAA